MKIEIQPPSECEIRYKAAIDALCSYLDEIEPLQEGFRHYVYLWLTDEFGPRIAEFGTVSVNSASSFQRYEPTASSMILAAEDFLLMFICTWDEREDELERAKESLAYLFRKINE